MHEDFAALGLSAPDHEPRAIPIHSAMIEMIARPDSSVT